MTVKKEKKCFSSFYTKTQLSDYVIRILTRHELFEIGLRVRKTRLRMLKQAITQPILINIMSQQYKKQPLL